MGVVFNTATSGPCSFQALLGLFPLCLFGRKNCLTQYPENLLSLAELSCLSAAPLSNQKRNPLGGFRISEPHSGSRGTPHCLIRTQTLLGSIQQQSVLDPREFCLFSSDRSVPACSWTKKWVTRAPDHHFDAPRWVGVADPCRQERCTTGTQVPLVVSK